MRSVVLYDGIAWIDGSPFADPSRGTESGVLTISPALAEIEMTVEEVMGFDNESPIEGISGSADGDACASAPPFPSKPANWTFNNCYSYANNERNTDSQFDGAQPGGGATPPLKSSALISAAKQDGLIFLGKKLPAACPVEPHTHFFAMLLLFHKNGKTKDYHCIRLDRNGKWSQKNPPDPVTDQDDVPTVMLDLKKAALFWSPKLVGFFQSEKGKRKIAFS
jgi:hypothetical protein